MQLTKYCLQLFVDELLVALIQVPIRNDEIVLTSAHSKHSQIDFP